MKAQDHAYQQAAAQMDSIAAMVAALEVDYDRLEALRNERDNYVRSIEGDPSEDTPENWANDLPDDAADLAELESMADDCESEEEARERIQEDALSVEVRSGWNPPGEEMEPEEYRIVLCTGGPHVEVVGELNQYREPVSARLLYQDWGTTKQEYLGNNRDTGALIAYASVFYFGGN